MSDDTKDNEAFFESRSILDLLPPDPKPKPKEVLSQSMSEEEDIADILNGIDFSNEDGQVNRKLAFTFAFRHPDKVDQLLLFAQKAKQYL